MFAIQALLQAHTDCLEQQQQAQAQQLTSKHGSELQSTVAALKADHQQQMQAAVEQASSKHAGQVAQTQQYLQKAEAMLAAEKQKSASLKVIICLLRVCLGETCFLLKRDWFPSCEFIMHATKQDLSVELSYLNLSLHRKPT